MNQAKANGRFHDSRSDVQKEIEQIVLPILSEQFGVKLLPDQKLRFDSDTWCEPDGATEDESVVVEIYAHQGALAGAQKHKPAVDLLKLATLRQTRPEARLIFVFLDDAAYRSFTGWKAYAADAFGVEVMTMPIDSEHAARILKTQDAQRRGATQFRSKGDPAP